MPPFANIAIALALVLSSGFVTAAMAEGEGETAPAASEAAVPSDDPQQRTGPATLIEPIVPPVKRVAPKTPVVAKPGAKSQPAAAPDKDKKTAPAAAAAKDAAKAGAAGKSPSPKSGAVVACASGERLDAKSKSCVKTAPPATTGALPAEKSSAPAAAAKD